MTGEDLLAQVEDLSRDAYRLARAMADGAGGDVVEQARGLDGRLDELLPAVRDCTGESAAAVQQAWSDARADALWVMSNGTMPASLRLGAYLSDRTR